MLAKGVTFKNYAEDAGSGCPSTSSGNYAVKHVPLAFFQDIVGKPPSAGNTTCTQHIVPFTQLATDLTGGTVAQYNFISPNQCSDMHSDCGTGDPIKQGDDWLKANLPAILASNAYKNDGAVFITWDESEGGELPIGMIVLSPLAKGNGYQSTKKYYHSSMVRTVQEVFGLSPMLNDAANSSTCRTSSRRSDVGGATSGYAAVAMPEVMHDDPLVRVTVDADAGLLRYERRRSLSPSLDEVKRVHDELLKGGPRAAAKGLRRLARPAPRAAA